LECVLLDVLDVEGLGDTTVLKSEVHKAEGGILDLKLDHGRTAVV